MNYVAFSGGADSTALAILLHERGEEFELVFADTGAELPETLWIVPRVAKQLRKRLHVVNGGTFYQKLVQYGWLLPDAQRRWCTRELKRLPQDRFWKHVGAEIVAVGIRADEPQRATLRPSGDYVYAYPLVEAGLTKEDVKVLCRRYDLLSPAYEWRSSTSCFCCPFQRRADWRGLLREHPDLYALAEDWEEHSVARSGYTWSGGFTLRELREASESQLALFPECEEEACSICRW